MFRRVGLADTRQIKKYKVILISSDNVYNKNKQTTAQGIKLSHRPSPKGGGWFVYGEKAPLTGRAMCAKHQNMGSFVVVIWAKKQW